MFNSPRPMPCNNKFCMKRSVPVHRDNLFDYDKSDTVSTPHRNEVKDKEYRDNNPWSDNFYIAHTNSNEDIVTTGVLINHDPKDSDNNYAVASFDFYEADPNEMIDITVTNLDGDIVATKENIGNIFFCIPENNTKAFADQLNFISTELAHNYNLIYNNNRLVSPGYWHRVNNK